MNVVVPLFLLAPLVLVPLGFRLLEVASPGSRPPALVSRLVLPAAALLALAFWLPAGPVAASLVVPWLAVTGVTALAAGARWLRDPARWRPSVRHATDAAVAFLAVGATFALTDRLGVRPFDFPATIILLTAVHFHFAGFVLPLAGALAYTKRPSRWLELAIGGVVIGIPVTALGFFGLPLANWSGAVLTAAGGFGIGMATLAVARVLPGGARGLAAVAGVTLLLSMPLAAIYATGTLTGAAWLGLDLMARVHGGLNALGFALPVMIAWTLARRSVERKTGPAGALDVIGFNAAPFVLGPIAAIVAGMAALASMPLMVRLPLAIGALAAALLSASAYVAVVWVFEIGARRRWAWIVDAADRPGRWANVTTGFDDSTATLRAQLPGSTGDAIDLFDPGLEHETALVRARRRFPPTAHGTKPAALGESLGRHHNDAVFLVMSAHEAHGTDRALLFGAAADSLVDGGRLILVEHLRDLPNRLAFGAGADHFQSRQTWVTTASDAGLDLTSEQRLTPYVRGFVFERSAT